MNTQGAKAIIEQVGMDILDQHYKVITWSKAEKNSTKFANLESAMNHYDTLRQNTSLIQIAVLSANGTVIAMDGILNGRGE